MIGKGRSLLAAALMLLSLPVLAWGPIALGNREIFTTQTGGVAYRLITQRVEVPQDCSLKFLALYVSPVYGYGSLGVYADSGGSPGALLFKTPTSILLTGWNTKSIPSVKVKAGAVHLAFIMSSNAAKVRSKQMGDGHAWRVQPNLNLPSEFGAATDSGPEQWSLYAVCDTGFPGIPQ